MKRFAWFLGPALTVGALALAPASLAARGDGPRHGHGRGERLAAELGLSPEQRTQMRSIMDKYRGGALGDHLRDLRQARADLREAIQDVKASDAQVQDAARSVASHQAFVAVERHRMAIEMDRILTPEQRAKAAELRQQRRDRGLGGSGDESED
ncbi:MAG TPA: Spy/CpxP family protein refolding chaperone [Candidatus Polarisedimenticolaceae bacterium]|nr:Spy/CpxP family protein refolding chaperone [Candidatus Polarisedimenticolaceae bacterium]